MTTVLFDPSYPSNGSQVLSQPLRDNFRSLASANGFRCRENPLDDQKVIVEPGIVIYDTPSGRKFKEIGQQTSPSIPTVTNPGQYKVCLLTLDPSTSSLAWISGAESNLPVANPDIPSGKIALSYVLRSQAGNGSPILNTDIIDLRTYSMIDVALSQANINLLTGGPLVDASTLHNHDSRYYTKSVLDDRFLDYKALIPHWRCNVYSPDPTMPVLSGNDPLPSAFSSDRLFPSPNHEILIPTIDGSIHVPDSILRLTSARQIALVFTARVNVTALTNISFSFLNDRCRSNIYLSNVGGGAGLALGDRTGYFPENAITYSPMGSATVARDYTLSIGSTPGIYDIQIVVYTLATGLTTTPNSWSFICQNKLLLDNNVNFVTV